MLLLSAKKMAPTGYEDFLFIIALGLHIKDGEDGDSSRVGWKVFKKTPTKCDRLWEKDALEN